MADFEQLMSGMFDCWTTMTSETQQDHKNNLDEEKQLDKTVDMTEITWHSYDPSTSFASWLSSQDFDGKIVMPSPTDIPLTDDDDETVREELLNGVSQETYDGSKPFAEWLSSRDADNVVLTSLSSPSQGKKHKQIESHTRITDTSCGCSDFMSQLNNGLIDTIHCDGDMQDHNHCYDEELSWENESIEVSIYDKIKLNAEKTYMTESREQEEHFPMDEIDEVDLHAIVPKNACVEQLDDGKRKTLSQMLSETSLFQQNTNPWMSGYSLDCDEISTGDLESFDEVLNNRDDVFRDLQSSTSAEHDAIFEKMMSVENKRKKIQKANFTSACELFAIEQSAQDNNQKCRLSSISDVENSRQKGGKENTVIAVTVFGRKSKEKYARHARKMRLSAGKSNAT